MQKVVIVNLNGIAYHLEERAFAALGAYLARAEAQLRDNPDRTEIVGDLEQAIADKFGRFLGPNKNVVTADDMTTILDEMGPVRDHAADAPQADSHDSSASSDAAPDPNGSPTGGVGSDADDARVADSTAEPRASAGADGSTTRRLYLMLESGWIGGVCSGIAAFINADVTIVRTIVLVAALFELGFLHSPFVCIAYVILMFVVPVADTSEARAAARGIPFNAQQLLDEAKRNFERIGEHDWKHTRREWRQQRRWERKVQRQMRRSWSWPPAPTTPPTYGAQVAAGFMTPILSLISVGAFWLMVYAVMSLASTNAVFGWHLPADVPLWLGLVGVLCIYNALVWPMHAAKRASYVRLGGPDFGRYEAFDGIISTALGVAIVWSAYHYSPNVQQWLHHLPDAWHNVVASVRTPS
jgi:phage shock protein PspC (stress-responsive transcriptional regulator)